MSYYPSYGKNLCAYAIHCFGACPDEERVSDSIRWLLLRYAHSLQGALPAAIRNHRLPLMRLLIANYRCDLTRESPLELMSILQSLIRGHGICILERVVKDYPRLFMSLLVSPFCPSPMDLDDALPFIIRHGASAYAVRVLVEKCGMRLPASADLQALVRSNAAVIPDMPPDMCNANAASILALFDAPRH